jgi:hypothetical protein
VLFRNEGSNLWNDIAIQHVIRKCISPMFQDRTELSGVVRIEDQFVILKTGIDPFVEPFPVPDLVADTDCPDVRIHLATLAGT